MQHRLVRSFRTESATQPLWNPSNPARAVYVHQARGPVLLQHSRMLLVRECAWSEGVGWRRNRPSKHRGVPRNVLFYVIYLTPTRHVQRHVLYITRDHRPQQPRLQDILAQQQLPRMKSARLPCVVIVKQLHESRHKVLRINPGLACGGGAFLRTFWRELRG